MIDIQEKLGIFDNVWSPKSMTRSDGLSKGNLFLFKYLDSNPYLQKLDTSHTKDDILENNKFIAPPENIFAYSDTEEESFEHKRKMDKYLSK